MEVTEKTHKYQKGPNVSGGREGKIVLGLRRQHPSLIGFEWETQRGKKGKCESEKIGSVVREKKKQQLNFNKGNFGKNKCERNFREASLKATTRLLTFRK